MLAAADELRLEVFPNVIDDRAAVRLTLPAADKVSLLLFNHQGQLLRTYLAVDYLEKGPHYYQLDAAHLSGGFYYLQALTPHGVAKQKLVVQR